MFLRRTELPLLLVIIGWFGHLGKLKVLLEDVGVEAVG